MFFVIDRQRLLKAIRVTRDDRKPRSRGRDGPFYRMEASGQTLKLSGREGEAELPATVYEPGVLFLRVTLFRWALADMTDQQTLAVQVTADGLHLDNVRFPLETNDMLVYPDPSSAPRIHPAERQRPDAPPSLFDPPPT